MRVLAIGAHFDDVEIGCGGSLAKHVDQGDEVEVFVATHSGYEGLDGKVVRDRAVARLEGAQAAKILGVGDIHCGNFDTNNLACDESLVVALRRIVDRYRPHLVYCHWLEDIHLDHHNLARAALSACRHVPSFLCYRSNLYPGKRPFDGRFVTNISATLERKRLACLAHKSEIERGLEELVQEILALNVADGARLSFDAVESFEIIRYVEK